LGGFDAFLRWGPTCAAGAPPRPGTEGDAEAQSREVASGTTKKVKVASPGALHRVRGAGGARQQGHELRDVCRHGRRRRARAALVRDSIVSVSPCPSCAAEGTVIQNPCPKCQGDGRVRAEKELEINVPRRRRRPSLPHDARPRSPRAAQRSGRRPCRRARHRRDPRFERHGDDLVFDLPISFTQAALGAAVENPDALRRTRPRDPAGHADRCGLPSARQGAAAGRRRRPRHVHVRVHSGRPSS